MWVTSARKTVVICDIQRRLVHTMMRDRSKNVPLGIKSCTHAEHTSSHICTLLPSGDSPPTACRQKPSNNIHTARKIADINTLRVQQQMLERFSVRPMFSWRLQIAPLQWNPTRCMRRDSADAAHSRALTSGLKHRPLPRSSCKRSTPRNQWQHDATVLSDRA